MSDPLRDELLSIARAVEALKRECGMDPESPTAIQNGRYMGISYRLRALADPLRDAPAELAEAVAEVASFLIGYGDVAELAAQKLRQALREHDAALDRAPTGAAPAGEALLREALELAIPYLEADSQCGYDGTNGSGIRQEAQRRLDIARAALAAPTEAASAISEPGPTRDEIDLLVMQFGKPHRHTARVAMARLLDFMDNARAALDAAPTGAAPEQAAQQGLENCRLYAARHRKEEWAKIILRLCKAGGAIGSPLREQAAQTSAAPTGAAAAPQGATNTPSRAGGAQTGPLRHDDIADVVDFVLAGPPRREIERAIVKYAAERLATRS